MKKASNKPNQMQPGIRQGALPPFYEIDEYLFENLCLDLFDEEPDIATCGHYGVRGQSQLGIDLKAFRKNKDGTEVGQCKCYKEFTEEDIIKVSDVFFEHWEHWAKIDIRRFILFVACDMSTTQLQDEIQNQRDRFAQVGITYEAWSAVTIRNKLRTLPEIVGRYVANPNYWIKEICGTAPADSLWHEQEAQKTVVVESALLERINQLTTEATEKELNLIREGYGRGEKKNAVEWINNTKMNQALWTGLNPHVKAKVLRFEAGISLETQVQTAKAMQLIEEAHALAPDDDSTALRALVLYRDGDPEAALRILEGDDSVEAVNIMAAIMLEQGESTKTLEILDF